MRCTLRVVCDMHNMIRESWCSTNDTARAVCRRTSTSHSQYGGRNENCSRANWIINDENNNDDTHYIRVRVVYAYVTDCNKYRVAFRCHRHHRRWQSVVSSQYNVWWYIFTKWRHTVVGDDDGGVGGGGSQHWRRQAHDGSLWNYVWCGFSFSSSSSSYLWLIALAVVAIVGVIVVRNSSLCALCAPLFHFVNLCFVFNLVSAR